MKSILYRPIIAVMLMIITCTAQSQDTLLPVNLHTVLEWCGANSLTIKEAQQQQELAIADHLKSKEWWLPNMYAGLQANQLWGAVQNGNGNFFLDVKRNNLWAGLGADLTWNFSDGLFKSRATKIQAQAVAYTTKAERNKALLEVIHTYYDLLAAQLQYRADQQLVNQADTLVQQIAIQVMAGLRYQSELLLAKTNHHRLRLELLNAKTAYDFQSNHLVKLLHLPVYTHLISVDTVLVPLETPAQLFTTQTYLDRPEWKAAELTLTSLQTEKKQASVGPWIPKLNIGTSGAYFGSLSGAVKPMFPLQYPETKMLYPTGTLGAALLWSIPLGRLVYAGDLKHYRALIKSQSIKTEQEHDRINEELATAWQQLLLGKEKLQIAEEALAFAKEAWQQSVERQKLGTAKPFEVFQAQQFLFQAHIDYLNTVSSFNKAHFTFKVAKGEQL